jgi:hypothetical protein
MIVMMMKERGLPSLLLLLIFSCQPSAGFHLRQPSFATVSTTTQLWDGKGDSLRAATGIRPSLHPTTINAIAEALKFRAMKKEGMTFRASEDVQPLEIAVTAGQIAATAVAKRQKQSEQDGMTLELKEEQTIAGRILGVIMRFDQLEDLLFEKVSNVGWIAEYNEWGAFGTLKSGNEGVDERVRDDPLFCVSRAECLLAIFLDTIEVPALEKTNEIVPDGSKIDFLDADRLKVLLQN